MEDSSEHKKAKRTKKCVIKRELMFENYKDSLFNNQIKLNLSKDLKVIIIRFIQKKSIKLREALMMMKDYKRLIKLLRIYMEQMLLKRVKVKC